MAALITLKDVTKEYNGQVVLRGIDLEIAPNEFVTFLGPSGCGKTTTLRIIGGFIDPSAGEVLFDGVDILKIPAYKRPTNTVFQRYALFPHLNVFENVAFGLRLKGANHRQKEDIKALKEELTHKLLHAPKEEHNTLKQTYNEKIKAIKKTFISNKEYEKFIE